MSKPFKISIPSPCHESWAAMTPAEKGRFCGSCQKLVHDFTRSSDTEILDVLAKENNACGRFSIAQSSKEINTSAYKSPTWLAASMAVISFLTSGTNDVLAQIQVQTEQAPHNTEELLGKVKVSEPINVITGTITDSEGIPIPGTNVIVLGTTSSTQSDFDGNYSIDAKAGDKIEYSFVGLKTRVVKVDISSTINVCLADDDLNLMGDIILLERRTFFGRVFTSVANWFRDEDKNIKYKGLHK